MSIKKTGGSAVPAIGVLVLILCLVLPLGAQESPARSVARRWILAEPRVPNVNSRS